MTRAPVFSLMPWLLTTSQKDDAVTRFAAGERTKNIAQDFGVCSATINALAKRRGISRSIAQGQRRVIYNERAFAPDSEAVRYWAGFLLADGSVVLGANNSPTVALVIKDLEHVEKFKSFLGSEHRIIPIANGTWRLAIRSGEMAQDLARFGVVPDKSLSADPGEGRHCRHFWRGVVDGDGSLGVYRSGVSLRLVGSKATIDAFLSFASTIVPHKVTARPHKSIYVAAFCGKYARPIIDELYRDCAVALDRKRNAAINILNRGNTPGVEPCHLAGVEARTLRAA